MTKRIYDITLEMVESDLTREDLMSEVLAIISTLKIRRAICRKQIVSYDVKEIK